MGQRLGILVRSLFTQTKGEVIVGLSKFLIEFDRLGGDGFAKLPAKSKRVPVL